MSWLYDDEDLSHQPETTAADSLPISATEDFELFHEHVAPIVVDETDLARTTSDQGIKHVRVRNLQWWTNENAIRELLTDCGVIKSVDFEASMKNGKSLGIANIEFDTSDAALRAIDRIDNREIDGKSINANLLVVEDVKVSSSGSQSQLQRASLHNHTHSGRKITASSPRRPARSPARTGPAGRDPPPDLSRPPNAPGRAGSTTRAVDHRRRDLDRSGTARPADWGRGPLPSTPAPPPPPPPSAASHHGLSSSAPSDRDHMRAGRASSSSHHREQSPSRRREPAIHRDRERLIHGDRASQRSTSKLDSHHPNDVDPSRRSSYPDDRPSSHSRRAAGDSDTVRDVQPDHERSRHRSHRDLDDQRVSRRMSEYSKDHHGSAYERHADRYHGRPEPDGLLRYSHHQDSDHRSRKRRR